MPHSPRIIIVLALLRLQRLVDTNRARRRAAQDPGAREHVLVQRGVLAGRDGVAQRVPEDGVGGCGFRRRWARAVTRRRTC